MTITGFIAYFLTHLLVFTTVFVLPLFVITYLICAAFGITLIMPTKDKDNRP
jgi:dolichol kinase